MPEDFSLFDPDPTSSPAMVNGPAPGHDSELNEVVEWFRAHVDLEAKFGSVFRQSIDEVLDGQRTGRYDIDCLTKTEKTYLGTKVEIVTKATFELEPGAEMDYRIEGHEVDAKFSLTSQWQIPSEAMGQLCLLMSANERQQTFEAGVLRITDDVLNNGRNKDQKATISSAAKKKIVWLCHGSPLPPNILLLLPTDLTARIVKQTSGQRRINELFRVEQGRVIDRNTALTVTMQADGLKRCRDARSQLRDEGIVVLGHQNESPKIARDLGLPVPEKGTFVSARLVPVPADTIGRKTTCINGVHYAFAQPHEPASPAPAIAY
ncbi:NaeI family type II restriction endonuclease [Saccharopolyspora sp. NPDC002578]